MKVAGIILAAGLSSRMGDFKPLLCLGGKSLVEHCADTFRAAGLEDILLVTGHSSSRLSPVAQKFHLRMVVNKRYQDGMFSSIQAGAGSLPEEIEAFFILPVDIPLVRPATVKTLLNASAANPEHVLIPCYYDKQGHPPLLPKSAIPRILEYHGAGGLRALLAGLPCQQVPVWDRFILHDADTARDFETFRQLYKHRNIPTNDETDVLMQHLVPAIGHAHARATGRAAVALGRELRQSGLFFDLDLLYAGGCLHDLAKGQPAHGLRAAKALQSMGLSEVADTVAEHSSIELHPDEPLTERHLVCLADKALCGDNIIEPKKRYLDKLEMYKQDAKACASITSRMNHGLALQKRYEELTGRKITDILEDNRK